MGQAISQGLEEYRDARVAPRTDRPATFDPLYGFPNGRKVREMKATWEEMDKAQLEVGMRDYCAHLLIPYYACMRKYAPLASHKCASEKHRWYICENKDHLIRMKEYERERRLLKRKLRKDMKAKAEAGQQLG